MNSLTTYKNNNITPVNTFDYSLLERFLQFLQVEEQSRKTYVNALSCFFSYLRDNNITDPVREDILNYVSFLKENYKPATVQLYVTAVRLLFKWTAQEGIYSNVAEHIKGAKVSREHKKDYLTAEQVKAIAGSFNRESLQGSRDYAIFVLAVTCGLRTVEISRATVEDLRTAGSSTVLYIQGKSRVDKSEYVKVPPATEQAIREYLSIRGKTASNEPLFASTSNRNKTGNMTTRSISRIIKSAFQVAGYDSDRLTAHSCRHTAVTLSLLAGMPIQEVQQFARHRNIATTLIYDHSIKAENNRCSEAVAGAIF
ncbi:MAG: tyrosine-type recombinase/integrase [Enterococcus sp.]|nr:tyrosine-type recombinase/integrase [Enterococcus sp.]